MPSQISFVPAATTSPNASAAASSATLANNFDSFLTILTSQIQNQDPLEPLDSTQFTEQLVQFSGVEQQIRGNQHLETLLSATRSTVGASLSGYLGQQAEISGAGAAYAGEPLTWRYELPAEAASVRISVLDSDGRAVSSTDGKKEAGVNDFKWDGRLANGKEAPPGAYYLSVAAEDADAAAISADVSVLATVTGVDLTYGDPALTTTAGVYAYSDIRRLARN